MPESSSSWEPGAPAYHMPQNAIFGRRLALDEIRLLKVHPAEDDSALHCTLSIHDLTEKRSFYVALSYCWGSTVSSRQIVCNDTPLAITESLYAALWQSRKSGDDECFWVDAVCINQSDDIEKTEQVRQMTRIYQYAQLVLVWIGEKREEDVGGLALIDKLSDIKAIRNREFETFTNQNLNMLEHGLPSLEDAAWVSMFEILDRPWFHRKWIIQEATVNQLVGFRCGDVDMNFYDVLLAATCFFYNNVWHFARSVLFRSGISQPSESSLMILLIIRVHMQGAKHFPLSRGLAYTRRFYASDPRDTYFALIGLSENNYQRFIDYRKSLREVIIDITTALIRDVASNEDGLDSPVQLMSWVGSVSDYETGQKLPSWIPDFFRPFTRDAPISMWLYRQDNNQEMLQLGIPEWRVTDEAKEILISKGKHHDTVTKISGLPNILRPGEEPHTELQITSKELDFFAKVFDLVSEACLELNPYEIERKLWRTLCCGNRLVAQALTEADWDSFQALLKMLNYRCIINGYPIPKWLDRVPKVDSDQVTNTLRRELNEAAGFFSRTTLSIRTTRRLFITQNGHVGMAPAETQPGDQVFFFLGSRFPLILRPVPFDSRVRFELVGDCYLDGFMDGEAHGALSGFEQVEII